MSWIWANVNPSAWVIAVATAGSGGPTAAAGPVALACVPGPLEDREKSIQPCDGGAASCGATVFGLIDLRSAFRPSPDPLGRVMLQPSLGTMTSCAAFVTGLMASQEPITPLPRSLANWSRTSCVVSDPTAT